MKDYYQILGVDKKASKEEIRKAFHKLAHKYHPDKQGGDEQKFKEVNEAYQTLSDDNKRAQYDMYGSAGAGYGGQGGQTGGWDFSNMGGQGFDFDLGDIFGEFFGGNRAREKRGRDISVDIVISFKESVFGTERKIRINKIAICEVCQGSGASKDSKMKKCETCDGKGRTTETRRSILGSFQTVKECTVCHGQGEIPEKKCPTCHGQGTRSKDEEIEINIPAGINNGEMIRMSGRGEAIGKKGINGDLYIRIHVERDNSWRRDGNDLTTDLKIKLTEAILGTDFKLKTLEGDLTLKIPAGITYGERLRIKGKGVPSRSGKRGDILVRVTFQTPDKISKKAKKIIEELQEEGL